MPAQPPLPEAAAGESRRFPTFLLFLLLALFCVPFMVSGRSLWSDEGMTARYALVPDFGAWYAHFSTSPHSEALMPLPTFLQFFWSRLLGTEEFWLRAPNLLYGAVAVLLFAHMGRRLGLAFLPLLLCVQPFFWYYMDEFRAYAVQIMAGSFLVAGIVELAVARTDRELRRATVLFSLGALLLGYCNLLGIIFVGAACLVLAIGMFRDLLPFRMFMIYGLLAAGLLLLPVGVYYVLAMGRAASARLWDTSLANFAFAFWELLGFQGISLPRDTLREALRGKNWAALQGSALRSAGLALLYLPALVAVPTLLFRPASSPAQEASRRLVGLLCAFVALATGLLFGLALVAKFAFWGRHLAPAFPAFVVILGLALRQLWQPERLPAFLGRGAVIALATVLAVSSLMIRFSPGQDRQDYRGAAQLAKDALKSGRNVWWVANAETGNYYGLTFESEVKPELPLYLHHPELDSVKNSPAPDLVLVNRPDVHDADGFVRAYLAEHQLQRLPDLAGFEVYEKKKKP